MARASADPFVPVESVLDASRAVPLAIMIAFTTNAALALLMVVTVAFTIGDVREVLATANMQPFVAMFLNTTGSKGATIAMVAPKVFCFLAAQIGIVAITSRQIWSFARAGGLPFAQKLQPVRSFFPTQARSRHWQPTAS